MGLYGGLVSTVSSGSGGSGSSAECAIETIKVNGVEQTPVDKVVDLSVTEVVSLTQAEYTALKSAGTVKDGVLYFCTDRDKVYYNGDLILVGKGAETSGTCTPNDSVGFSGGSIEWIKVGDVCMVNIADVTGSGDYVSISNDMVPVPLGQTTYMNRFPLFNQSNEVVGTVEVSGGTLIMHKNSKSTASQQLYATFTYLGY